MGELLPSHPACAIFKILPEQTGSVSDNLGGQGSP